MPANTVATIEEFLRGYPVEPKPDELPDLKLTDRNGLLVIGSAIRSGARVLITGGREMLELRAKPRRLRIVSPRVLESGNTQEEHGVRIAAGIGEPVRQSRIRPFERAERRYS